MAGYSDEEKSNSDFSEKNGEKKNHTDNKIVKNLLGFNKNTEEIPNDFNQDERIDDIFEENKSQLKPEEIILQLKAKNYENNLELWKCDKVRCLALSKIIYGKTHWKVAEAHIELANAYLKEKYFPQQTLKHVKLANELLFKMNKESQEVQLLVLKLYLAMGLAHYQLRKYKTAENCFQKAKLVSDSCNAATDIFLEVKVKVLTSLSKTVGKMGQMGLAVEYLETALAAANGMSKNKNLKMAKLYIQLIKLELMNGKHINISTANEAGLKALEYLSTSKNIDKIANVHLLLSRVESKKELVDYSNVEYHIQEALKIHIENFDREKIISLQSMLCKVLIQQNRYAEAKDALQKCVEDCEITYGDLSIECAELYELIGSLNLDQKNFSDALAYLLKAEEIFSGKRIHKARQEKLLKVIDIIRKSSKDESLKTGSEKLKERPRFT